jgi:nuclear cap-binding protein subunit 2
MRPQRYA